MNKKIMEMLKKVLPGDSLNEFTGAIDEMVTEAKSELEAEFNSKLEEAYKECSQEITEAEKVAEQGYTEAYGIITELRNRLDQQKQEYEAAQEEGFEEAFQMLMSEKAKNEDLEKRLYEEYDGKLGDMKNYIVDKMSQFLQYKGKEIYEQATRDVMSNPVMAEQKVVLDKIIDHLSGYLTTEDRTMATGSKLEEAQRIITDQKAQIKLMEGRNIRLDMDVKRLTEATRQNATTIKEHRENGKQERLKNAKNVTGRGRIVEDSQVEVIKEHNQAPVKAYDTESTLNEQDEIVQMRILAGVAKSSNI